MSDQEMAVMEMHAENVEDTGSTTPAGPPPQVEATAETPPPAETAEAPAEDEGFSIHTLKPGRHLTGTVKNITNFGAFVDIGLPQDGLVHISELSRRKVEKVSDVVSVGQEIEVWVKKVDKKRGRISLTMVKPITRRLRDIKVDDELEGTVTRLETYGAFIDIESDREGLVHISQITHDYIKHPEEALTIGEKVKVKVLKVNRKKRQVDLSIKALLPPPAPEPVAAPSRQESVEAEQPEPESTEGESLPTAMALAYAAFQDEKQDNGSAKAKAAAKAKAQQSNEMDAIVARTLAARE